MKIDNNSNQDVNPNESAQPIENKTVLIIIQIIGWMLLASCIYRWIIFFFFYDYYRPLTHTTYLTLIIISLTCIKKLDSIMLNSATCVSLLLFIFVSIIFIPLTNDLSSFLNGFGLHFAIVLFQLYILFNKKVAISKKALVWSFLLYLIFISSYDSFARINAAIKMSENIPEIQLIVITFYLLAISALMNYLYKKKYGILLP
ncbi:MAG: hypothetical protein ACTSPS_11675 [Promethearchaeota archaeon]